jgi:hypothetical protein
MLVYISGPMTGLPDNNFPAFIEAKKMLEKIGHGVVSPVDAPKSDSWEEYMRHDIRLLSMCNAIYYLPGYGNSRGAMLEKIIADELGLEVIQDGQAPALIKGNLISEPTSKPQ